MSSEPSDYKISVMSRYEVQIAINWASIEGWNPGLCDADCFYAADPQGFFIGKINDQPVATISAVRYGATFGFIGLYIVESNFRRKGYGIRIWNKALGHLKGRNVGLDGVVSQQEHYKKSGFTLAHRNIRFAGLSRNPGRTPAKIVNLAALSFADVATYDRDFFPEKRDNFLRAWINQPNCRALGIMENNKLHGYGVIRACQTGYKIGPLNAESADLAAGLFDALVSTIPSDSTVYLDTPEQNVKAVELAQARGMKPSIETARMYTGEFPGLPLDKVFGITSFELG